MAAKTATTKTTKKPATKKPKAADAKKAPAKTKAAAKTAAKPAAKSAAKSNGAEDKSEAAPAKSPAKGAVFKAGNIILSADPESKITSSQLKGLYEKLMQERSRLIEGVKRHVGEAVEDQDRLPDDVDLANRHANQAYLLRFADKENKLLRQINLALSKLESGEYGVCEGTGEPIGYARLKIRPWTRYSVQYKEELERLKSQQKR